MKEHYQSLLGKLCQKTKEEESQPADNTPPVSTMARGQSCIYVSKINSYRIKKKRKETTVQFIKKTNEAYINGKKKREMNKPLLVNPELKLFMYIFLL